MSFVVPNEGEIEFLQDAKSAFSSSARTVDLELVLVKDGVTLDSDSVFADVTANEADFSGYAAIPLDGSDFDAIATDANNKAYMRTSAYHTFTHNGGGTANDIKYYALIDRDGAKLRCFEDLPTVQTMAENGDPISIKPKLTMVTEVGN